MYPTGIFAQSLYKYSFFIDPQAPGAKKND